MLDEDAMVPTETLEVVAYLARSANRVAILDALASGAYTRRELTEATGTSRTTLDRIVNELEDRGWAERTDSGEYVATAVGVQLMREFRPFVRAVEAIRRLGTTVEWLPTEELHIGLEHFADATVRRPAQDDPVETIDFIIDLVRRGSEFRVITNLTPPKSLLEAMWEEATSGQLSVEGIVPTEHVEHLGRQPDRRRRWRELIEAGTELYRYDGTIPCNMFLADGTVLIKRRDPGVMTESYGRPIVSDNGTVLSWSHELVDRYRADATRINVEAFPATEGASDSRAGGR